MECVFGILKESCSFLNKKVDLKLNLVPMVTHACFELHNICAISTSYIHQDLMKQQIW